MTAGEGLLVVGPARARWPEPLEGWVASGRLEVRTVANLHEAAVVLASEEGFTARGILLDPAVVNGGQIRLVELLTRRVRLPVVLLPLKGDVNPSARRAGQAGVLTWEDGCDLIAGRMEGAAADALDGERAPGEDALPATEEQAGAEVDEMGVTLPVEARYDEVASQPLLSDAELQALLGTAE